MQTGTEEILQHNGAMSTPCNPSSTPLILGPASIPVFFMHFVTLCRKCLKKTGTVVSYLIKCRSERMSCLVRNMTALRDWRILEVNMICSITNHALLFIVRGLRRKWKQPVAYYLIRGSIKAEMLVHFLKDILGACQNVGLHVVATDCNMGTNNVKGHETVGFNWVTAILPVSKSSNCHNI
jgi:hypothetical protein